MQEIYERHPEDPLHPEVLRHWARLGVRKELFDADTDGRYAVFTPLDLGGGLGGGESAATPECRRPLVYVSHGGLEPINHAETNGWAELAGREGLIVVYPWNRGPSNDDVQSEFPRILDALTARGYPIDPTRVYAVGYSAGSDATGVLACVYPDVLAAVSPSPGGNLFAKGRWHADRSSYAKNGPLRLPLICVAGTMDGGDVYPLVAQEHLDNFSIWMTHIAKARDFEPLTLERSRAIAGTSPDAAERAFGFEFHRTFSFTREEMQWVGGDFFGDEGTVVARFVAGIGLPHAVTATHSLLIWDYLKHFSRDRATGESLYSPVSLPYARCRRASSGAGRSLGGGRAGALTTAAAEVLAAPRIVLGGAFGLEPQADSAARLEAFVAAGGTFVETGYTYVAGKAMAAVGQWLAANPGQLRVVMKIGHGERGVDIPLSRANIRHDLLDALRVLRVDSLGVLLLHCDDPARPVEEIVDTLAEAAAEGLADSVGASNWSASRLAALVDALAERGHTPLASYHHSLAELDPRLAPGSSRAANDDLLDLIDRHDLPLLCWSANAGGFFARSGNEPPVHPDMFDTAASGERRERVRALAGQFGVEPATLALAWTLARDRNWVSVGPEDAHQLAQAFAAAALTLSPAQRAWLRHGDSPAPPLA
ncbi:MAG: aldo/keto reductase [Bifidobacteriaceae bacterium]|nr:aldo/keto reductase [Bifidobacteriaceae bacterium]